MQNKTASEIQLPIEKEELCALVPHKGKMFLLSRVNKFDVENLQIELEYDVTEQCIFYDESLKGIPSWCSFEIMAQGVAALASIKNIVNRVQDKPSPGVVLSLSNFNAEVDSFPQESTIVINVKEDYSSGEVSKFSCTILSGKNGKLEQAVSASLTVMEVKDMEKKLG